MADEADVASLVIDRELSMALSKIRQQPQSPGTKECLECGDAMPEVRQKMGFKHCKDCTEQMERHKSRFADY